MVAELRKSFESYLKIAGRIIVKRDSNIENKSIFHLHKNESRELGEFALTAEKQPAFQNLINVTIKTFHDQKKLLDALRVNFSEIIDVFIVDNEVFWVFAVRNFFRNCGIYSDLYSRNRLNIGKFFEKYCDAFQADSFEINYLVPIPTFTFKGHTEMDFENFKLQKFNKNELNALFKVNINEAFFSWAGIDADLFNNIWFLHTKETLPLLSYSWNHIEDFHDTQTSFYPPVIESALKVLSLCNWTRGGIDKEMFFNTEEILKKIGVSVESEKRKDHINWLFKDFYPFSIGSVIEIYNHPLLFPHNSLKTKNIPFIINDPVIYKVIEEYSDHPENIEEKNFSESISFHSLSKKETGELYKFTKKTKRLLENIKSVGEKWDFIFLALDRLSKAFNSKIKEDQLLWHIVVLETLAGEKQNLLVKLSNRVAFILGDTNTKRDHLRKIILELYDFRSSLVHGVKPKVQIYQHHLNFARQLARKTLLWYLYFLNHLKNRRLDNSELPGWNDILMLIDLAKEKKLSIGKFIDNLPNNFPNIKNGDDVLI